jgi:hypothetical protein
MLIKFVLVFSLVFSGSLLFAKKVDLEDIQIKGELHNDNRLRFYQRNRAKLENHVRIRKDFRDRIKQASPLMKTHFELKKMRD